jgi:hypothetical protein
MSYFQGAGAGAGPFFHGAGAGAGPFFQGAGAGAGPFFPTSAEPSPCVVANVFAPIASVKTSMAREIDASMRDIECLRGIK